MTHDAKGLPRSKGLRFRHEADIPPGTRVYSIWKGRQLLGWLDEGQGYRTECWCCHRLTGTWVPSVERALDALGSHLRPRLELAS